MGWPVVPVTVQTGSAKGLPCGIACAAMVMGAAPAGGVIDTSKQSCGTSASPEPEASGMPTSPSGYEGPASTGSDASLSDGPASTHGPGASAAPQAAASAANATPATARA